MRGEFCRTGVQRVWQKSGHPTYGQIRSNSEMRNCQLQTANWSNICTGIPPRRSFTKRRPRGQQILASSLKMQTLWNPRGRSPHARARP